MKSLKIISIKVIQNDFDISPNNITATLVFNFNDGREITEIVYVNKSYDDGSYYNLTKQFLNEEFEDKSNYTIIDLSKFDSSDDKIYDISFEILLNKTDTEKTSMIYSFDFILP